MARSTSAFTRSNNLFGQPGLVTLDANGNCTSANCNPTSQPDRLSQALGRQLVRGSCFGLRTAALAAVLIGGTAAVMICASGARSNTSAGYQAGGYQAGVQVRGAQEARKRPRCVPRAKRATSAAGVRRAVASRRDVCVTARVGDVDFSDMGNRSGVVVSTDGGAMGHLEIDSTTGLTIRSARFRSVTIRHGNRTSITRSTIGGTRRHRVYDQLIFAPDTSPNVTIRNNEIAWTLADDSGGTGYGCRCYGTLDNFRFTGNWVHDIAADGLQGFNGTNITIDRNNIGPVGANPGSSEHSDIDPGRRQRCWDEDHQQLPPRPGLLA